jgi:hypothetical protein
MGKDGYVTTRPTPPFLRGRQGLWLIRVEAALGVLVLVGGVVLLSQNPSEWWNWFDIALGMFFLVMAVYWSRLRRGELITPEGLHHPGSP